MSTATTMYAAYLAAEEAILAGKESRIGDRAVRFEDLPAVIAGRKEWEARVRAEGDRAAGAATIGGLSYAVARLDR